MKKLKANFIFILMIGLFVTTMPAQKVNAQASVSFQFFYDELSPYGSWVSYPQYGYVWVPAVRTGFRPYLTNGHWILTDDGWMWASYYDWGWAPFHYGSWVMDPEFGWAWVPGYDWAPAWVTWGNYNGYYGWAPIQPGFSITVGGYNPPIDYWCFMHPHYMTAAYYNDHFYVAHDRRIELGSNTTVINNVTNITVVNNINRRNNTSFNAGPRRTEFENTAKVKVQPVSIREISKPARISEEGNAVSVFRPRVTKENVAAEKPQKINSPDEVKHANIASENGNLRNAKVATDRTHPAQPVEGKEQPKKINNPSQQSRDIKPERQAEPKKQNTVVPMDATHSQESPKPQQPRQNNIQVPRDKTQQVSPPSMKPVQTQPQQTKSAPVQRQVRQQHQPRPPQNDRINQRQPVQNQVPREQMQQHEDHEPRKK